MTRQPFERIAYALRTSSPRVASAWPIESDEYYTASMRWEGTVPQMDSSWFCAGVPSLSGACSGN